jgi:cytochrome d ubiquinol oxidase subunit I
MQFAFTMSFHILFPAITIGLASYLAVLELCWLKTKRQVFVDLYHFWLRSSPSISAWAWSPAS